MSNKPTYHMAAMTNVDTEIATRLSGETEVIEEVVNDISARKMSRLLSTKWDRSAIDGFICEEWAPGMVRVALKQPQRFSRERLLDTIDEVTKFLEENGYQILSSRTQIVDNYYALLMVTK